MAVLIEGVSVVVRRDAIDRRYSGRWPAFQLAVPNQTLCADGELARVGFLDPASTEEYVRRLQGCGLTFLEDGEAVDMVVVDQQRGPTTACSWIEFARIPCGKGDGRVGVAWLFDEPRIAEGIHLREGKLEISTPEGWEFEGSLSDRFTFVKVGA